MKQYFAFFTLFLVSSFSISMYAQNSEEPEALDLPGDNLNLYAVLDVFQKSKTLEAFETAINDPEGKINNLDLNNDNKVDYIEVSSEKKGNTFLVLLQVAINQSQKQDVAVIEVDKNKKGEVIVQIIGDEELYGNDYVIEPRDVASKSYTPNPGFNGSNTTIINNTTNNYNADAGNNVSVWPVVLNLFSPFFIPWHSPWRWGYYPSYWRPWRPVYYHDYWGYNRRFTNYYYRTNVIRTPYYRSYYANRRMYSAIVRNNRINGLYRSTYNGRVYKKPVYPGLRPNGSNRPGVNRPVTLPSNKYPNRPVGGNNSQNRPTTLPSNKYPNRPVGGNNGVNRPTTLPSNKYPNRPVGGNNGANRPTTFPSTKYPAVNRPVSPSTRPSTPTTFPSTRPANNPMTRPTARPANYPMARPAARPRATPVGRGTSPNRSGSRSNN